MARGKRIIGYGICGPGEAGRYMRNTLEEFKRLCDEVVILVNDHGQTGTAPEKALITEYGFRMVQDHREWGLHQWRIKQDLLDHHVRSRASDGDVMVALDMDERFDRHLTRDWLLAMPFDAYHTYVVDLWNDYEHYKPESCFWKVQIWRWNGVVDWTRKPLHCGLAPRWAASYNRYAPFLMVHTGLMLREDRQRKIARYEKYDPHAHYLAKPYYAMLHSDTALPFDEERLHATIESEVSTYKQSRPRVTPTMAQPKGRFAYVQNPGGATLDIPEKQLAETLKRKGFVFVGWADEAEEEMEQMFAEEEVPASHAPTGSYQRSMEDEKREVEELNGADDAKLNEETTRAIAEELPTPPSTPVVTPDVPVLKDRLGLRSADSIRKAAKTAPKKAAKKAK